MANIAAAQAARIEKYLDKKVVSERGIERVRHRLERMHREGAVLVYRTENKIKDMTRVQSNRCDWSEYNAFQKKQREAGTVEQGYLQCGDVFFPVGKVEADYFMSLSKNGGAL